MKNQKEKPEELTAKMHAEFFVDAQTEKKHTAFAGWELIGLDANDASIDSACHLYGITRTDMFSFRDQFAALRGLSRD